MKKIFTLLLVIITIGGYSQTNQPFLDSVSIEMMSYLNKLQKDSGYSIYNDHPDANKLSEIHTKYMLKHNIISHKETIGVDVEKYGRAINRLKTLYNNKWWNVTEVIAARRNFNIEDYTIEELSTLLINQLINSHYHRIALLGYPNINRYITKFCEFYIAYNPTNKTIYCTGSILY